MYAVIETGGKQYRVEVGTQLEVELLDVEPGADMQFERVLLVADGDTAAIGRPLVENASVAAHVVGHDRGDKVISFKYRPKARRRVKKGHRQELTVLRISDIVLDGHSAAADVEAAEAARQRDRSKVEEAARRQAAADAELAAKLAADKPAAPKRGASSSETTASTDAAAGGPKGRATRGAGKASDSASGGGARTSSAKSGPAKKGSGSATTSRSSASASGEKTTGAKASGTQSRKTQAGGAESAAPKRTAKPRSKKES